MAVTYRRIGQEEVEAYADSSAGGTHQGGAAGRQTVGRVRKGQVGDARKVVSGEQRQPIGRVPEVHLTSEPTE
jgi:hypothetical protein